MTRTASPIAPHDVGTLYDAHASDVLRIAISVLGDRQLAEDVTHEVFLRLWRSPESLDPSRGDIGAVVRAMARDVAIDAWRRAGSATEREVIALAYWGRLSASEIARDAGVPLGTVKSRMRRGLQRLRAELDGGTELASA